MGSVVFIVCFADENLSDVPQQETSVAEVIL